MMWNSAYKRTEASPWLLGEFGALTPVFLGLIVAALLWRVGAPATAAEGGKQR